MINSKELLNALDKIKPALKINQFMDYAGLVIFTGENITAYGDDLTVCVPFKTNFKIALPADELTKLIKKISSKEVEMTLEENQLILKAGRTKAGFNIIAIDLGNLEFMDFKNINNWKPLPIDFTEALAFCHFSAANDASLGVLTNLCVEKNQVISSDDPRISQYIFEEELDIDLSILIPKKIAEFLSKIELKEISIGDSMIYYKDDDGVIYAHRVIADEFLDTSEFLNVEGEEITLPKELLKSLNKAQIFSDKIDNYQKVTVKIQKDCIVVRGEGIKGWVEDPVDLEEETDKQFEFLADPAHLIQILSKTQNAVINENVIMFGGDNFKHIVSLLSEEE